MRRLPFRGYLMITSACAWMTLICWIIYEFTRIDVKPTIHPLELRNLSTFLQNVASKLNISLIPKTQRKRKFVLLWTKCYSKTEWLPSTTDLHCPVDECDVTSNRSMLANSSAVIFHWRSTNVYDLPQCVASQDGQCPLWVLYNREAPPHTPRDILQELQSRVHWTATYRKDSDLFAPYGEIVPNEGFDIKIPEFDPNRRLVCWLVSNCNTPSKREVFVNELKSYIDVDIYGQCGDRQCPYKTGRSCYEWLSRRCKFYLSLENSNCKDYVTEKLYYALSSGMIPVVMGNSSNYNHLPFRSYINAADFRSPKELAEYLVQVGEDKDLYLLYFQWMKYYMVNDVAYEWFCQLCEKLHKNGVPTETSQRNLTSWWFSESGCM